MEVRANMNQYVTGTVIKKQHNFVLGVDREKNIFRQIHLSGHGRNENDAEHAKQHGSECTSGG